MKSPRTFLPRHEIDVRVVRARILINAGQPTWRACVAVGLCKSTYQRRVNRALASEFGVAITAR
jgi:hypothetical protein